MSAKQPKFTETQTVYSLGEPGIITDSYYDWAVGSWYYFVDFGRGEGRIREDVLSKTPPPSPERMKKILEAADYSWILIDRLNYV